MKTKPKFRGRIRVRCYDKDGKLKWTAKGRNGIVDVGIEDLLNVVFGGSAATGTWFIGLLDGASAPTLAPADTMGSHAGWTEFTNYSEASRPAWTEDVAANREMTNTTDVAFSINGAGGIVAGIIIVSNSTKGGATGVLWATGLFDEGNRAVVTGDTLNITYTISG